MIVSVGPTADNCGSIQRLKMSNAEQAREAPLSPMRVVLLGTGTPRPDPARSGPATAIVVNEATYLVDFGPGVVRRAAEA